MSPGLDSSRDDNHPRLRRKSRKSNEQGNLLLVLVKKITWAEAASSRENFSSLASALQI